MLLTGFEYMARYFISFFMMFIQNGIGISYRIVIILYILKKLIE